MDEEIITFTYMKFCLNFILLLFVLVAKSQIAEFVRNPYLQITGPNSTYICWKTDNQCFSKVLYSTNKYNLNLISYNSTPDTLHFNQLTGLAPSTKYFYTVSKNNVSMSSDTFYFYTAPAPGSGQKIRVLALGDCGTNYSQQLNVKASINNFCKNKYVNCVLLLGDNAYNNGLETEYQTGFFNPYNSNFIFSKSCIYPAPGNHDYAQDFSLASNKNVPYYSIFKTPLLGELGGTPSYNKAFYSYNYGNTHFISLDSYGIESSMYHLWDSLGPQYLWLEQDLKNDKSMWKIVYFHHPPFTMGSHNSDTEMDLVYIRRNLAHLLEKYGVDLVINGHSHLYERSWLQKGHYSLEGTFNKSVHTIDSSSAKYDGSVNSCPYKKDTSDNKGTVYVVAGAAGKLGITQSTYPHNCMYFSDNTKSGALILEIEQNRLDAFYIEEDSLVHDKFTILKNVNKKINFNTFSGYNTPISASWIGNYNWVFDGKHTKTNIINISTASQFVVTDSLNCLADTFNIGIVGLKENQASKHFKLYPNPIKDKLQIEVIDDISYLEIKLFDLKGQKVLVKTLEFNNKIGVLNLSSYNLSNGEYIISIKINGIYYSHKILLEK